MVVRGAAKGAETAESEDEVSVSMCGCVGGKAYPAARSAASDGVMRCVTRDTLLGTLTMATGVAYITRVSVRSFTQRAT